MTGGCNAASSGESIGRKEAEKFDRASPVGWHEQIGLNCIGCRPSSARRATTVHRARQRSVRRTPLTLYFAASTWRDGVGGTRDLKRRGSDAPRCWPRQKRVRRREVLSKLVSLNRQGYSTPPKCMKVENRNTGTRSVCPARNWASRDGRRWMPPRAELP